MVRELDKELELEGIFIAMADDTFAKIDEYFKEV